MFVLPFLYFISQSLYFHFTFHSIYFLRSNYFFKLKNFLHSPISLVFFFLVEISLHCLISRSTFIFPFHLLVLLILFPFTLNFATSLLSPLKALCHQKPNAFAIQSKSYRKKIIRIFSFALCSVFFLILNISTLRGIFFLIIFVLNGWK